MDTGTLTYKLSAISGLMRLSKQYGTLLVLWPTLWSLFIASDGRPSAMHLIIFIAGTFLMRSAGCVINDIADRGFDGHVERTRERPLASGRLKAKEAVFVFIVLALAAFSLVLFLNMYTVILSLAGIILAAVYPFVKRVSHYPQIVLGMAFGWGAVMAWSAVHESIGPAAVLLFGANICWSVAYDTIYALMDIEDDKKIGVKSTAIAFGKRVFTAIRISYAGAAALLLLAGYATGLGPVFYAGIAISTAIFFMITSMVEKRPTRENAFKGFVANAGVGAFILASIIIDLNL